MLIGAHERNPSDVQALLALARGDEQAVSSEARHALRQRYLNWFTSDGSFAPLVSDVLLSAFRTTPDGSMLVNPFQLSHQADVDSFNRAEQQYVRALRRLPGQDDPPYQAR